MADQRLGDLFLQLRWSVPEERVAEFEAWYDEEHLGDMIAVPGILGGRRFAREPVPYASPSEYGFLTVYQVAGMEAFERPEFQALVTDPSPWTRRVAFDLPLSRTVYKSRTPLSGRGPAGSALLHVQMSAPDELLADFHSWYDEEHVPALLGADRVLAARRYVAVEDGAEFGKDGPRHDHLAVYELASVDVATDPGFLAASAPTPRRKALGEAVTAHVQVYRQCFPAEGAAE